MIKIHQILYNNKNLQQNSKNNWSNNSNKLFNNINTLQKNKRKLLMKSYNPNNNQMIIQITKNLKIHRELKKRNLKNKITIKFRKIKLQNHLKLNKKMILYQKI